MDTLRPSYPFKQERFANHPIDGPACYVEPPVGNKYPWADLPQRERPTISRRCVSSLSLMANHGRIPRRRARRDIPTGLPYDFKPSVVCRALKISGKQKKFGGRRVSFASLVLVDLYSRPLSQGRHPSARARLK